MHRIRIVLGALTLVFCCGARDVADADSRDDAENRPVVKACLLALKSTSPEVRASARNVILRLGPTSFPLVIEEMGRVPGGPPWDELNPVATSMDVEWVKAIEEMMKVSDAARKERLEELHRTAKQSGSETKDALAGVDPAVAEVLAAIDPKRASSSQSLEMKKMIALGHSAVPALLKALTQCDAVGQRARASTAAYALRELVTEEDAPAIEAAVLEGHGIAAVATERLSAPRAAAILAKAFDRDLIGPAVEKAAKERTGQPVLTKAVTSWIQRHLLRTRPDDLTVVVEVLGRIGDETAIPLLVKVDEQIPLEVESKWQVSAARIRLGDADAVIPLVGLFGTHAKLKGFVAGTLRDIFGDLIPEKVWNRGAKGDPRPDSTFDVEAFVAWWDAAHAKFTFDRKSGRWVLKSK